MTSESVSQPANGKTWKEINKEHWDNVADDVFSHKWVRDMHLQIKDYLHDHLAWFGIPEDAQYEAGSGVRILDYACGNGILSISLSPYAKILRGIDISTTMVQRYNESAAKAELSPERMKAVEADLVGNDPVLSAAASGADFQEFDVALISLALHHVEDPVGVLRGMASRLAPGGKLVVIDWKRSTPEEEAQETKEGGGEGAHEHHGHEHHGHEHHGHDHGHGHGHGHAHAHGDGVKTAMTTVVRHGFTEEELKGYLGEAGLANVDIRVMSDPVAMPSSAFGRKLRVMFGVAEKPKN